MDGLVVKVICQPGYLAKDVGLEGLVWSLQRDVVTWEQHLQIPRGGRVLKKDYMGIIQQDLENSWLGCFTDDRSIPECLRSLIDLLASFWPSMSVISAHPQLQSESFPTSLVLLLLLLLLLSSIFWILASLAVSLLRASNLTFIHSFSWVFTEYEIPC